MYFGSPDLMTLVAREELRRLDGNISACNVIYLPQVCVDMSCSTTGSSGVALASKLYSLMKAICNFDHCSQSMFFLMKFNEPSLLLCDPILSYTLLS